MHRTAAIASAREPALASADTPSSAGNAIIALIAFLTVVDLFATQAILPALAIAYNVNPAAMGTAVNACTLGMAVAGLAISFFSTSIPRRTGIAGSLSLLAVPTTLLAVAPDLTTFAALRIVQGLLMATAFSLTLAYLSEETCGRATAAAFAAYITGNVASNLFGRLLSAGLVEVVGTTGNFFVFAGLNIAGAVLAYTILTSMRHRPVDVPNSRPSVATFRSNVVDPALRPAFAIGFCILFSFIGTFTYVGFLLVRPPFGLDMMALGLVYLAFLPSLVTTPLAGHAVRTLGTPKALCASLATAAAGLPALLSGSLSLVIAGLALVAAGTFLAQAITTAYVGRTAREAPGAASGIYLASYFLGGLVGSAILGQIFVRNGWPACVAGIGLALFVAAGLAGRLHSPSRREADP